MLTDFQFFFTLGLGLERYHEAYPIPNTQYYWPAAIPIPNTDTDTEYDVISKHISVTNLFPPANVTATVIITADQTDGQFAICDERGGGRS